MNEQSAKFTATLCDDVYELTRKSTLDLANEFLTQKYKGLLKFSENNMLAGKTGGPAFIKVKTGFGFTLVGDNQLSGHAFILFRGTQYLADWLTNANILFSASASGEKVHDGFNRAFKSMLPNIASFVNSLPSGTKIHCLGHSLGGALATLCADWIKQNSPLETYLYTYGSPRVGFEGFSNCCTKAMTTNNIFRVFHRTDIVPCIPTWPFVHTPNAGKQYYIYSPGDMPGGEWHSMAKYVQSVKKYSWGQLHAVGQANQIDLDVGKWLKDTSKKCFYSVINLQWISEALRFVVSKCLKIANAAYNFATSSYSTLMDRLALILSKGALTDGSISNWVSLLITKITQFLGLKDKTPKNGEKPNAASIRSILIRLQAKANAMAKSALSHALAEGRAI